MQPPLILVDQGDVSVFKTVGDLEQYVESPDIAEYSVYDALGRRCFFTGPTPRSQRSGVIQRIEAGKLDQQRSGPDAAVELTTILKAFLRRRGHTLAGDALTLSQLLEKTIEVAGYTR